MTLVATLDEHRTDALLEQLERAVTREQVGADDAPKLKGAALLYADPFG